jgi:hypothetical protein
VSRSRKKYPGYSIGCPAQTQWKRYSNRKFRRKSKKALSLDEEPPDKLSEVADIWGSPADAWYWPAIGPWYDLDYYKNWIK